MSEKQYKVTFLYWFKYECHVHIIEVIFLKIIDKLE